ncbi:MAG: SMP-30/gluconolactonase/LRE family protein [Treponema sp.]|jgi:gluconolactonase|nr:SMP-30/gluconolactonase/LRE family protein [Treponema sp.]
MDITIKKLSPKADRLFPGTNLRQLTTGDYLFTEGPVWDSGEDCLYFTDFQKLTIWKWTEKSGAILYRENSNRAIGLSMDARGRIVSAESGAHRIAYADNQASIPIVSDFNGKQLNSPNDVVVSKEGYILFTDPYSDMLGGPRVLGFNGIFSVSPKGETRLVDDVFERPNGIALSPDESVLYVNDTKQQSIYAFSFGKDGKTSRIGLFAKVDESYGKGAVDGMKVDTLGNVYVTGPGGIWVFDSAGTPLAVLFIPEQAGNFCFGGRDAKTIYITASTSVYALDAGVPGVVPFRR